MLFTIVGNNSENGRSEILNGESYIVYPVVMLTVGVHSGSGGPTLYTHEELSSFVPAWNGVPVTLHHPNLNGAPVSANTPEIYENQVLGTLFNVVYSNNKLKGEIWLRNSSIEKLDPGLRGKLLRGEKLEVSTGLFTEDEQVSGTFNNEEYMSIARNIRPDHLALLPGGVGACSWEDGCGVRANEREGKMIRRKKTMKTNSNTKEEKQNEKYFVNTEKFEINELDYTKIVSLMHEKIDGMDIEGERVNYLKRVYPTYVIYSTHYRNNEPSKTMKRTYSIQNDTVVWDGDPIQVTENVSYEEITNNKKGNKEEESMEKVKTMRECCPDKVDELIKANANFTEDNKEVLLDMSEDQFALTINVAKDIKTVKDVEDIKDNEKKKVEEPKKMSDEEFLANAPKELIETLSYGKKMLAVNRKTNIDIILTNKSNQFTEKELNDFDLEMLEKLANMTPKVAHNYGPNGGSVPKQNASGVEPLPKQNSWENKEKKE